MSPIGRAFIVLNLILAGVFVGVSSSYIQRQHHWKTQATEEAEARKEETARLSNQLEKANKEVREMSSSARSFESLYDGVKNDLAQSQDEVKRLRDKESDLQATLAGLQGTTGAIDSTLKQAWAQISEVSKKSMDAISARDDAIRERDEKVAENRNLNNQIADLNSTIEQKDMQLAEIGQTNSRLDLLVTAARAKGFIDRMAVPVLDGTISVVTGNLLTVAITNNPSEAEVKPGYRFAIYDAASSTYKGEARVTSVDSATNAAFCKLEIQKGDVVAGDKASTHLAGVTN